MVVFATFPLSFLLFHCLCAFMVTTQRGMPTTATVTLDWWRVKWARAWTASVQLYSLSFLRILVFWNVLCLEMRMQQTVLDVDFKWQICAWMNEGWYMDYKVVKSCHGHESFLKSTWRRGNSWGVEDMLHLWSMFPSKCLSTHTPY